MHLIGFIIRTVAVFYIMRCRLPEEHLPSATVRTQNLLKYLLNSFTYFEKKTEIKYYHLLFIAPIAFITQRKFLRRFIALQASTLSSFYCPVIHNTKTVTARTSV